MNGVPEPRAPRVLASSPARSASSMSSAGSRNVIASVEPGASAASCRSVAAVASLVRYMLTPVDATTAGRSASKPAADNPSHQLAPVSKSIGTSRSQSGMPKPTSTRRRRFHAWVPGWSTSKIRRLAPSSGRRWARVSSPAPRMTYWVTPAAACSATRSSMKRARATIAARNPRVPTGCMSGRSRQLASGAASCRPTTSSSTCGAESTSTCIARQSATRTAVLSGWSACSASMANKLACHVQKGQRHAL